MNSAMHENGASGNDPETYSVIGAAMEVHRQLGNGFLEAVYQEALALELAERNVPFQREVDLPVLYKGRPLKCSYRADFVCFSGVIVEPKALGELTTREHSQVVNYLKATRLFRALLITAVHTGIAHEVSFLASNPRLSAIERVLFG